MQTEEFLKEIFAEHVARYQKDETTGLEVLDFRKPGTGIFSLRFICDMRRGVLAVYGDLEPAVYRWQAKVSLDWIAGCNLHYVVGKLEASRGGNRGRTWCETCARAGLRDWMRQWREIAHDEGRKRLFTDDQREIFREARGQLDTYEGWCAFLNQEGWELFGSDWWEGPARWGETIDWIHQAHLYALKLAMLQVGSLPAHRVVAA